MERQEIEHCVNQRPVYETDSGNIFSWNDPLEIGGETTDPSHFIYHPFVFDIETSAELGQEPILLVGYNTLEDRLIVLYKFGYSEFSITKKEIREIIDFDVSKLSLHSLSKSNFEKFILNPIAEWNQLADERNDPHRISLVAHNAEFDIPMMGTPNDEILDNSHIGEQYEMAVYYNDIHMISHRAGAFGQIYTFLDSSEDFKNLRIPVGDTLVASKALYLPRNDLKGACESLGVDIEVSEASEHGI
ncbi:MAG: hypothetical protein ACOC4M_14145, partial [Promethearchaeia archaeon]